MELTSLLTQAIEQQASDLHLSCGQPPLLRIHGEMQPIKTEPLLATEIEQLLQQLFTDAQKMQFAEQLECDFAYMHPNGARFRVNAFQQYRGPAAVLRIIPATIPTLQQLQLPDRLNKLTRLPSGLVLITGPTGSGKSTTLAAMIDDINTNNSKHIVTIEDPIEFIHPCKNSLINQREIHRHTHSFNAALRSALREDPDIILIGEMRDLETIRLALTAAETGHLVFATLHTNSAAKTIDRIINVFPAEEQSLVRTSLAESLQAVISQALLPRADKLGRVAGLEMMISTPAIRNLIRENKVPQIYSAIQTGATHGMCTMEQYLRKLVDAHTIAAIARPELMPV